MIFLLGLSKVSRTSFRSLKNYFKPEKSVFLLQTFANRLVQIESKVRNFKAVFFLTLGYIFNIFIAL